MTDKIEISEALSNLFAFMYHFDLHREALEKDAKQLLRDLKEYPSEEFIKALVDDFYDRY